MDEIEEAAKCLEKRLRKELPNDIVSVKIVNGKVWGAITPKPESISDLLLRAGKCTNETYGRDPMITGTLEEYYGIEFILRKQNKDILGKEEENLRDAEALFSKEVTVYKQKAADESNKLLKC